MLTAGTKLGPYEIGTPLGAGGMGEVYRAHDTRLDREVALKLLPVETLGDDDARTRLIQEAKTASSLNHPHICTVYDVGESSEQTYVAMEYVEGRPLSQQIPHDGLPLELVLRYGGQIADALAYAHEHGIVHRDLKTANVMVTPDGRAKVLDFGLARRLRKSEIAEATLSKTSLANSHEIAGTLPYMAPEVLRGEAPDARGDVWALGVVLYEMAAGQLPFAGKTTYDLTSSILREPLPPLPARVPAGLRSVIQRCLAKEPGQRYRQIGEVRSALEAIGSSDTLAAAATSASDEARRKLPVRILLAAGIVLVLGVLGFILRGRIARSKQGTSAQGEVAKLSGPRTSTGAPASANKEANDYFERGMLFTVAHFDVPRARQMFEHALELDPKFTEARAWHGVSFVLMVDSAYSNDSSWLYKAEEDLHRALDEDANSAAAYCGLAGVYFHQGRKELMPAVIEKSLKATPDLACTKYWLGAYHQFNGNNAEAKAIYQQVLDKNPLFGWARWNLADIFRTEGELGIARRVAETLLEQSPNDDGSRMLLSFVCEDSGDFEKAQSVLEIAPGTKQDFFNRLAAARLHAAEGKRNEALREMDDGLLKFFEVNKYFTMGAAEIFSAVGETDKALDWLERAVNGGDERVEWFRRDPMLKNIRNHPRFQQILASATARRQQRGAVQATP
jgi:tetratricopeptide (TPR) repeat protein/predicted Ser/Thr protein kinase